MSTKCAKCHEHLTHLEDVVKCSSCENQTHYYCNSISEANFRKMSKNTKSRNICFDCQNNKNSKLNTDSNRYLEIKIEELIKSVSFMSIKFDTFENKLETISNEIKYIKKENEQIKLN